MQFTGFEFAASDEKIIHAYRWPAANDPVAVLLIIHGMAEHSLRYDHFADFLNHHDIAVYSLDLRGHGKTAGSADECGFFADHNGWMRVVNDIAEFLQMIRFRHPSNPIFMLGHSMGSFLARTYLALHSDTLQGCILSGTSTHPFALLRVAGFIASLQTVFYGKRHPGKFLDKLSFGAYNKNIKEPRTKFDWLSRDNKIVDRYVDDPYCGFVCSASFFSDLFTGLKFMNTQTNINKTNADLPLLFIAGSEDPVSDYTKGMNKAAERFKLAGVKDITVKTYDGGRHEMLNELNKAEVYNDILNWLKKYAGKS